MFGRQWQPLRVEIIDGQVAIRVDDDGPRTFFDCGGVDAVTKSFLNDDSVTEVSFCLREQVANGDRLARARQAEQHRMLR